MKKHKFTAFNRDEFVNVFAEVFDDYTIDHLYDLCVERIMKYPYILFYAEDTYVISNIETGIIITWYKHLGRSAICNMCDFSIIDLRDFINDLKEVI